MNNTREPYRLTIDSFLWGLVGLLLVGGIAANYYFIKVATALRVAGWIVLLCVVVALIFQTGQGRYLWAFGQDAKVELRKVVWPTRDETVQTTLIIALIVIAMALILWGLDSILLWSVGWLTGQRG